MAEQMVIEQVSKQMFQLLDWNKAKKLIDGFGGQSFVGDVNESQPGDKPGSASVLREKL